ncbi:MAG: hypothetical protein ACYTGX_09850 [Planctomycetota bacterium]|jgi:hypothetical protein
MAPFLIGSIVIAIAAILVAYMMHGKTKDLENQLYQAQVATADAEQKVADRQATLFALAEVVGFTPEGEGESMPDVSSISAALEDVNNNTLQPKIEGRPLTCQLVIKNLVENVASKRNYFTDLETQRDNWKTKLDQAKENHAAELATQRQATAQVRNERDALQTRFDKRVQDDEEMQASLRSQLENTRSELEKERESHRATEVKFKGEVALLKTRITELTQVEERRTTDLPDGGIIRGLERDFDPRGEGYSFIYIDIGRKHGVKNGTKFNVFALEKGGKRTPKGTIVVKQALDDMAECAILDQIDDKNPIVKGDFVWNRFFEKGATNHFALVGTFDGETTRHTKGEWERIIKEHGHSFQDRIKANTTFVILGTDPANDTEQWRWREMYKVEAVTENEVLQWFDYGTYKARQGASAGN